MMVSLYRTRSDGATRYVTITDRQQNLFGYPTLSVTSGTDFLMTRERHFTYATEAEQQRALRTMIDRRLHSGFEVLYSYFRGDDQRSLAHKLRALQASGAGPRHQTGTS